jgi:regulator of cell morphogenesis and NO signaling
METSELTADTTVSSIAANYPASLRMLEALGIDYCCGGKLPLAEAAAKAGVPVETALAVLHTAIAQAVAAPAAGEDWLHADLDNLMAHILRTHHTYMHHEMSRLEAMLALVVRVHGPNHADVLQPLAAHYAALKRELEAHLRKEEEVTFPAIAKLAAGQVDEAVARTIAELSTEHEAAGELLAAMRADTGDYALPADACTTYGAVYNSLCELEKDIHQHIHLENNILFPRALKLATPCGCH